jgi:hypothetical protein
MENPYNLKGTPVISNFVLTPEHKKYIEDNQEIWSYHYNKNKADYKLQKQRAEKERQRNNRRKQKELIDLENK